MEFAQYISMCAQYSPVMSRVACARCGVHLERLCATTPRLQCCPRAMIGYKRLLEEGSLGRFVNLTLLAKLDDYVSIGKLLRMRITG